MRMLRVFGSRISPSRNHSYLQIDGHIDNSLIPAQIVTHQGHTHAGRDNVTEKFLSLKTFKLQYISELRLWVILKIKHMHIADIQIWYIAFQWQFACNRFKIPWNQYLHTQCTYIIQNDDTKYIHVQRILLVVQRRCLITSDYLIN